MSASFQALPNPGPPGQPGMIYPTTTTTSTSSTSNDQANPSDHSSGSFGMVFVVLAIILVISAIACVVGRLCGKKSHKSDHPKAHKNKSHGHGNHNHNHNYPASRNPGGYNNHSHMMNMNHHQANHHKGGNPQKHGGMPGGGRPRNPDLEFGYRSKEGDIMVGFDPKARMVPTAKVSHNSGDFRVDSMGRGGMEPHHNMDPRNFH